MRRSLIPNIVTLQAFECAARHENFSRAAEELNLTQSAVSRQVSELEQQTGLLLFERVRRRVILSEAGRRILPEVRDLLARAERLMIGAVAAGQMKGALHLASLPTFASQWLVPRLPRFMALYPDIALTMESRSRPFNFDEGNFDLAIHFGQPTWAGGQASFLFREHIAPVASPALFERHGLLELGRLSDAPLLHLITRPRLWADWSEYHAIALDNPYLGPRFDQFSMITAAAVAGVGVALLPSYMIQRELAERALVVITTRPMRTENAYYIVRPESKHSAEAEAFLAWITAEARQDSIPRAKGLLAPPL